MVRTRYSPMFIAKSAQIMRNRMTTAEGILWEKLSNGFDNQRFRRQYLIGNHSVDFYCRKLKLIVEISRTGCHVQEERDAHLRDADAYLRACGYTILRFAEKEIIADPSRIVSIIGLRVRLIRMNARISFVKDMVRHVLHAILSFPFPKRRLYAETNHELKLLMEF